LADRARDLLTAHASDPAAAARNHGSVAGVLATLVTVMKRVATNRLAGDGDEAGLKLLEGIDDIMAPVGAALA
jgi:hypothetical protein